MFSASDDPITKLQTDIFELREQLKCKEQELQHLMNKQHANQRDFNGLLPEEVARYSRQIIMPEIGVSGQNALKKSKVLIVGIGGLGCPAALYVCAAGVGEITLIDNDDVEISNLHRQILHSEADLGVPKVQSAYTKLISLNHNIKCIPIKIHANSNTLNEIVQQNKYNVIIDGSDNVATRYLLNDICIFNKIPLVSGSALQMEGQLTVYNHGNGPCYRCLFPVPPPANTVTSCGDGGVLGAVPGCIGVLQALEVIKIIVGSPGVLSGRLLLFDGADTTFRNIKLRGKDPKCKVCGDSPEILKPIDYEEFCGSKAHDKVVDISILNPEENIDVQEFSNHLVSNTLILDVRPENEYSMCHLPHTVNVPYTSIVKKDAYMELIHGILRKNKESDLVYVVCRRGNDSQRAVAQLKKDFVDLPVKFVNVLGGLHAYSKFVDPSFPVY